MSSRKKAWKLDFEGYDGGRVIHLTCSIKATLIPHSGTMLELSPAYTYEMASCGRCGRRIPKNIAKARNLMRAIRRETRH